MDLTKLSKLGKYYERKLHEMRSIDLVMALALIHHLAIYYHSDRIASVRSKKFVNH